MGLAYNDMARTGMVVPFSAGASFPSDIRQVVDKESDIVGKDENDSYNYRKVFISPKGTATAYEGMVVYAKDTASLYVLKSKNGNLEFEKLGSKININDYYDTLDNRYLNKTESIFRFAGSYQDAADLPAASAELVGKVYNIRNPFTKEEPVLDNNGVPKKVVKDGEEFLQLETRNYPAGTNVVCYELKYSLNKKSGNTTELKEFTDYLWEPLGGITEWDWEDVD